MITFCKNKFEKAVNLYLIFQPICKFYILELKQSFDRKQMLVFHGREFFFMRMTLVCHSCNFFKQDFHGATLFVDGGL